MSNYVGQGVQNISSGFQQTFVQPVQNFIQPFQSISQTNPIQNIQMGIVSGIQNFTNPQQQIGGAPIPPVQINSTFIGGAPIPPSIETPNIFSQFSGALQTGMRTSFALIPGGMGLAMVSDAGFAEIGRASCRERV
jgi:hypothetical protein